MGSRVSFVLCCALAISSAGNVPLMYSGYAKTSFAGSTASGSRSGSMSGLAPLPQIRSGRPDNENDLNKPSGRGYSRTYVVPTSFSENRLPVSVPLTKNPEDEPIKQRSFSQDAAPVEGRALSNMNSNSLTSAIARSFQDVLPSDINSLTSSASTSSPSPSPVYDADIQKSNLANEYSYGNGYYDVGSPDYSQSQVAQERYHPQRPLQAGYYPPDYLTNPPTGTVSDVGDIPSSNDAMPLSQSPKFPPNYYQPSPSPPPPDSYSPGMYRPPYNPNPYTYNPPAEPPEEPPTNDDDDEDDDLDKGVYTHYNIGRKLYYAPLWFSLYYAGYVFVEICKHVWRHKYTFPVRVEDALGIGRSAGENSTHLDSVAKVVSQALESKKYHSS